MRKLVRRFRREIVGLANVSGIATAGRFLGALAISAPQVLRARSLSPADRWMTRRPRSWTIDGATIVVPGRNFAGAREMYGRAVYFRNARVQLKHDDAVVDLGANAGLFTVLAARKARRVIAVEAQGGFASEVRALAEKNGVGDRVMVEQVLVGGEAGVLSVPGALLRATHWNGTEPQRMSMSELMRKHGLERIGFLKCDIEGSEFAIMTEAADWLDRVDRIAMEVHMDFGQPAELVRILSRKGFEIELRDNDLEVQSRLDSSGYLYAWRPQGLH